MSTKTTFKRIALVAVAALGFGTLSVAPSTAGQDQSNISIITSSTTGTVGTAVSATINHNFVATGDKKGFAGAAFYATPQTSSLTTADGLTWTKDTEISTHVNVLEAGFYSAYNIPGATYTKDVITEGVALGRVNNTIKLGFTPDKAGTYLVRIFGFPNGTQTAIFVDWTVVVTDVDVTATAASTTSFLNASETTTATVDSVVSAPMALSDTATATIVVSPKNAAAAAIAAAALTVTVSGPGTVAVGASLAAISALSSGIGRAVTGAAGSYYVGVFADGTAGVSTITISSGTTVLATETVTFYGAAAKITPTVVNSVLKIGVNTGAVTAVVTDALGTPVTGTIVYAVSDTAATIGTAYVASTSSLATGVVSFDLTGVAAGTAKITLTLNSATTGTSTVSAVAGTMRVSDGVVTKVAYAFDKESYFPGEAAKITATVSNAAGVMPAGTYTVLTTAVTSNFSLVGLPGTLTVDSLLSTGVATYTTTIPAGISGALTLTGVAATGVTATFGSATVVNAAQEVAQAAADAAAEAIDAANAATDAANAAAEAADAATAAAQDAADAVAALSVQVTEQIAELKAQNDALRKQLIALTNLIIKIQKKVNA
jgi:hypothetical protein